MNDGSQCSFDGDLEALYLRETSRSFQQDYQICYAALEEADRALRATRDSPGAFSSDVKENRAAESERCLQAVTNLLSYAFCFMLNK